MSISPPVLTTARQGKQALSFSIQLSSAAFLRIALVARSGKTLQHFGTDAKMGRTRLAIAIPNTALAKGSHLTLTVTIASRGRTRTISLPVKG